MVLWADDNLQNNTFERQAFESVGIRFVLSETTRDALDILSRQSFGAIISDMGRRDGPREGYALLDALRARDDGTPLFFYSDSNAAEHRRETQEHGGKAAQTMARSFSRWSPERSFAHSLLEESAL
jgi:DNA-binding NtrC family response regulator